MNQAFTVSLMTLALSAPSIAVAQDAPVSPLAALVAELETASPELQAARREIEMRRARIAPAGALPDPTLSASSMAGFSRPPFFPSSSTPDAFRMVSVAQEIPYPGKRSLRTNVAELEVEAEQFNFEDRRRRLVVDLKTAYLDYVLAVRSLEVLEENRTLLDQLRQIAEARFSVGRGVQQDVVKAQLELSMLLERRTLLEQQRRTAVAALNALLDRPQTAAEPPAAPVTSAPPPEMAALVAQIDATSAAMQRHLRLVQKDQRALELARTEIKPDFRVGVSAQRYVGGMPWMYGVDLMVTLPIYASRKQRPLAAEAAAALEATSHMHHRERAMAISEVAQLYAAMDAADRLIALYGDSVLPQSRLALESSLAAYQVGSVDFLSVLTNFQAVVAAQLSRLEQQTRRDQALARLEPYAGREFVR